MRFAFIYFFILSLNYVSGQQYSLDDFTMLPKLKWSFQTSEPIFSSPVAVNNHIFFAGLDSNVYAVNANSGQPTWKFSTKGPIRATPLFYRENLYVNSGDGYLYCLDLNGKEIWKFRRPEEKTYELYGYADYFHSSPVADSNTVFFGGGDSTIYALDAGSGNLIWRYKTGNLVHGTGTISNRLFVIGSFDGRVYALDKKTGMLAWSFKSVGQQYFPLGEMQGSAFSFANIIIIGSRDYNLYALDASKGYGTWNRKFPKGWAMGVPRVEDSILYVGTSDDMELLALNPFTGETKWKAPLNFNIFGAPAFTSNVVYCGTLMGRLFGIEKATGKILWDFKTENFLKNRNQYFQADESYRSDIQRIIQKGDDFLTMYYSLGAIFSTPLIYGGHLYFTSTDGKLYCLKKSS